LVVVSVTETAGPDAACAAPGLITAMPAMSAVAPSAAVMLLMRDMVLALPSVETICNILKRFCYHDESSAK
jgi:hypothetical protein